MKKVLIISLSIILALVSLRFITTKIAEKKRAKAAQSRQVMPVGLKKVEYKDVFKTIEVAGRVQSQDKVDLIARIDGYLQKKNFKEGDFVKKGQVLLTIEQAQYLNNLNKAKADLKNAQAVLYKAKRDYQRGEELVKKDFISKSTYDGLMADKDAATAKVMAAEAALAEAQRNYSYTLIKSPVDGKIGSLQIQEGNYVSAQSGTLATVVKTNPIYVQYSVDSKQFSELRNQDFLPKKGESEVKVQLILPNGEEYDKFGVQDFYDNQISLAHGTIDFRATFENDDNILIPGDFVKVKVFSNKQNKELVVPQEFTMQDSKGKFVYVIDENSTVQAKYFKDKGQYGAYWLVKSGLEENDEFISTNITMLMPKMKVVPMLSQPDKDCCPKTTEDKKGSKGDSK